MRVKRLFGCALLTLVFLGLAAQTNAEVIVPDNGHGTADMPLQTDILPWGAGVFRISDGLPSGTTIDINARLGSFFDVFTEGSLEVEHSGGTLLDGTMKKYGGILKMPMVGIGTLAGFQREINLNLQMETHYGPRISDAPVQGFDTDMFIMQGQIIGDPDFDLLRITGGTGFGMPSPGHTTLTRLGPPGSNWAVDSFFDITYRIDFVGAPGGPLGGRSGSTTGTIRMGTTPEPGSIVLVSMALVSLLAYAYRRRRFQFSLKHLTAFAALAVAWIAIPIATAQADLVTNDPNLPPAGVYLTPADVHATYGSDPAALQVILDRIEHRPSTEGVTRYIDGEDEQEFFGSSMHGVGRLIMGGDTTPMTVDMNGPVCTQVLGKIGHTTGTFDTEMLSLNLTGSTPFGPLMIRESPTQASIGRTSITDIGGGQYRIDSFFDVFTELSVDGGQTWMPSAGATHVDLVPEPGVLTLLTTAALGLGLAWWARRRSKA